ncbi:tigger transposable element-derived protein 4-like [Ornithodoros turicata]|uniref:tigger transposable element-derived protein 4-like n=1 Tax=Ornithodoros turicata TaxID=34597 RepID=UPI00313A3F18
MLVIPGGLTSQLQPLDVSVNKPFKNHVLTPAGRIKRAPLTEVCKWVASAWAALPRDLLMHVQEVWTVWMMMSPTAVTKSAAARQRKSLLTREAEPETRREEGRHNKNSRKHAPASVVGWQDSRPGTASRVVSGEAAAADIDGAHDWKNGKLQEILGGYAPEDIFNMDESALFYRLGIQRRGSEKLSLLVIGKTANPRCFKGRKLPSGVLYRSNAKAWMTSKVFEEYVRLLDRRFTAKGRKIVIALDNASSHTQLENWTSVELAFLPPNTTAIVQPLDQGVIRSVKQIYRKNIMRRILLEMENDKTYATDLLGAVHLLQHSWQQVEPSTVENCFRHAGFMVCTDSTVQGENSEEDNADDECEGILLELLERQGAADSVQFHVFPDIDNGVETCPDWSDSEIVASMVSESSSATSGDTDNDEDDREEIEDSEGPSVAEAVQALEVMRQFAVRRGLLEELSSGLGAFGKVVIDTRQPRCQAKILDFLVEIE